MREAINGNLDCIYLGLSHLGDALFVVLKVIHFLEA